MNIVVRETIRFAIKDTSNGKIYFNNNNMGWLSFDRARSRMKYLAASGRLSKPVIVVLKEVTTQENEVSV